MFEPQKPQLTSTEPKQKFGLQRVNGVSLRFLVAGSWRYSALTLTWSFEIAINAFMLQGELVKVSLRRIYDVVFHPALPIFKH